MDKIYDGYPDNFYPTNTVIDQFGNLFQMDFHRNLVTKISSSGNLEASYGTTGRNPGEFDGLVDLAITNEGNVVVFDRGNQRMHLLTSNLEFLRSISMPWIPQEVVVNQQGVMFWRSYESIYQCDADGANPVQVCDLGSLKYGYAKNMAFSPSGDLYVAFEEYVVHLSSSFQLIRLIGEYGKLPGRFIDATSVAVGPDGLIYVADGDQERISVFTSDGAYVTQWPSYDYWMFEMSFGPDGKLYVTGNSMRRWSLGQ